MGDMDRGQQISLPWTQEGDEAPKAAKTEGCSAASRCRVAAAAIEKHVLAKYESAKGMLAQAPTGRRQAMADSMGRDGMHLESVQRTLYKLAEMHEQGTIPAELRGLTSRAAIERELFRVDGSDVLRSIYEAGKRIETSIEKASRLEREALLKSIPGFVPTPAPLAAEFVAFAGIEGTNVLEPLAGTGSLIDAVRQRHPALSISYCELNPHLREILTLKYEGISNVQFLRPDFRMLEPSILPGGFDAVIMNPPFEQGQDIDHVLHAHSFLASAGVLAAIVSEGAFQRKDQKAKSFHRFLESENATVRIIEAGAFKPSGTSVFCRMIRVRARRAHPEKSNAVIPFSRAKTRA
jgi:predicted RNA methylase